MVSLAKKRIEDVFRDVLKSVENGRQPNIKQAMLKHGYALISAEKNKVTQSKTWDKLLKEIDDEEILNKIKDIMRDEDKRSSLAAADMLLKLKDKYPEQKTKIMGLFGALKE